MEVRSEDAPRLTDLQMNEVLQLLKKVDSVELKMTVPVAAQRATIRGLPLDPVEAEPRQVYFFDTPDLALDRAGLVVRARRIAGGRADTVVKLRPVEPDKLPAELRRNAAFNVEVDVLPGGFVCSGSLKGRSTGQEVRDAAHGKLALRKVFSKEQRAFFAAHAPADAKLDVLSALGPIFVLKSVFDADMTESGAATARRMVAELWLYPDGSRILELSTKCLPREAFQVAAETRAWLVSLGIELAGAQATKTRTALSFFAAELATPAVPHAG
jgi:hypothetical protein